MERSHGEAVTLSPDRSMRLIRDAIDLVVAGVAPRVVVAGIGSGELLLGPATRLALEAGVRARSLPRPDGQGTDIAVEQIHD